MRRGSAQDGSQPALQAGRLSWPLLLAGFLLTAFLGFFPSHPSLAFAQDLDSLPESTETDSATDSPALPDRKLRIPSLLPSAATAHSVLLKDLTTGETLYERQSHRRLSPASLTKIMSALIILEYARLESQVLVTREASRARKIRLRLRAGELISLEDLLKAMLISSANDACLAAAQHVGGSEERFVQLMNAKALALSLSDTHFSNACGFDAPDHYSTAADLARLSEVAMAHPLFRTYVGEEKEVITALNVDRSYRLRNTNRLLGRMPGVEGVKTGFTSRAGRCLVAKVNQDGKELLLVLLNAKRRWTTATSFIHYGLQTLSVSQQSDR